jgi:histidine triad (HIT) family protein
MDCLFCKIAASQIPCSKVYEDDKILAFKDINPEAPVHILIIPKEHISSVMDINEENKTLISHIYLAAGKIAAELGISQTGFRIVTNSGEDGGQTVEHLHFHMLGGRNLKWPPG